MGTVLALSLDHVHIIVPNRMEAAKWFAQALDFEPDSQLLQWQDDPEGPLVIRSRDGDARLALFARATPEAPHDNTIAFGTSGAAFLRYIARLKAAGVRDGDGPTVSLGSVVDHELAWSIYFQDPWGNRFEITTYEREAVSAALEQK